nr:NADH dehydrogenase subunit 4L [Melanodrymia sp. A LZ-2023]
MLQISYFLILGVVGIFCSLVVLVMQYKHLLSCLLSLEAMTLSLFIFLLGTTMVDNSEAYMLLVFLTFAACEASLGLAILVSLIRTHGNDYVHSFSMQKC